MAGAAGPGESSERRYSREVAAPRIEVRPYLPAHLGRILSIERACFAGEAYTGELFRHFYEACSDLFLTAFRDGRIVGYSITCARGHSAEIVSIAVDPTHQRDGAGSALLAYSINRLRRSHCQELHLMVRASDRGAIGFYRGFGFVAGETVDAYYRDGAAGLRMERAI